MTTSESEPLAEQRQRRAQLLQFQHYEPLIAEVLAEELPKYAHSTVIDPTDTIQHLRECALILASASPVLTAAVSGNLVMRLMAEPQLQSEYTALSDRAHYQPSIYAHFLTDAHGVPPTPNQYLTISNAVHDYLAEGTVSPHALQIDNMTSPPVAPQRSHAGHRKYLCTRACARSPSRIQALQHFCAGAQTRWLQTPAALRNTPFTHPPAECGYSRHAPTRLAQHRARHASNYVMNLVEDTCAYLHRAGVFEQRFSMHPFVVFLLFRRGQAAMAEILCSGLLQVWVDRGGGFNACPAGRSVASAGRVGRGDWTVYERQARLESCVVENMEVQRQRAEAWRRALDWEDGGRVEGEVEEEEGEAGEETAESE